MNARPRRSSVWLINEAYIELLPSLACALGVDEALFLANLQRWIRTSRHEMDGHVWVYNKLPQWREQLPFFPLRTLQRVIANLRDGGVILVTDQYNASRSDRTSWYTIDYEELDRQMEAWFEAQEMGDAKMAHPHAKMASPHAKMASSIYNESKALTTLGDGAAAPAPAPQAVAADPPTDGGEENPSAHTESGGNSKRPKLSEHPLIQAYRALHEQYPEKAQMKLIVETNPPLDNWVRAMRSWSAIGYRKGNIAGQLKWAMNPALIEEGKPSSAKKNAGIHVQPSAPYVPTAEEEEAERVWEEKVRSKSKEQAYPED